MSQLAAVVVLTGLICLWAGWYLWRAYRVARSLKGTRVVTCPETARPAAVRIDVSHAVATALTEPEPEVRLADCSRWPDRGPCDERCLPEAQMRTNTAYAIAARWFSGRPCVYCGKPIAAIQGNEGGAALLAADATTIEWSDIEPERLPDLLRTHWPVCARCHVAETFRRTHPELVTDRP